VKQSERSTIGENNITFETDIATVFIPYCLAGQAVRLPPVSLRLDNPNRPTEPRTQGPIAPR
jgi:hypothetical protein